MGAKTSGNIATFVEDDQMILKTWSDYFQKFKLDTFKMNSGAVVDGRVFASQFMALQIEGENKERKVQIHVRDPGDQTFTQVASIDNYVVSMDAIYDYSQTRYSFYGIQTSPAGATLEEVQIPSRDKAQQKSSTKIETSCTDLKLKVGQSVVVVSCRTSNELFIYRRTGPAGIKLIYQVKDDNNNRFKAGADTIEIIGSAGPFVDQAYIFVGKDNNADIQFYVVLIDELATDNQELILVHQDFKKKNL